MAVIATLYCLTMSVCPFQSKIKCNVEQRRIKSMCIAQKISQSNAIQSRRFRWSVPLHPWSLARKCPHRGTFLTNVRPGNLQGGHPLVWAEELFYDPEWYGQQYFMRSRRSLDTQKNIRRQNSHLELYSRLQNLIYIIISWIFGG